MIKTRIDTDSINTHGNRLTTFVITLPRFLLAEFTRHRALSFNTGSSRAIPISKAVEAVRENPHPFHVYMRPHKGMQGEEEMSCAEESNFRRAWEMLMLDALRFVDKVEGYASKQLVNRALEPFGHVTAVVTATEWANFFALRAHPAAQKEFQLLAYSMLRDYLFSEPVLCRPGEWHIPLLTKEERESRELYTGERLITSVARACYISYNRIPEKKTLEEMQFRHDSGIEEGHFSPFEHQAYSTNAERTQSGNFKGWVQYRQSFPGQNKADADLSRIWDRRPDWVNDAMDETEG